MRRLTLLTSCLGMLVACSDSGPTSTELVSEVSELRTAASASAWTAKVTGGGMSYNINSCNVLYQNVSARSLNGTARGQVQVTAYYGNGSYPDCVPDAIWFQYHAVVTDLVVGTAPDGAKVANVCGDCASESAATSPPGVHRG